MNGFQSLTSFVRDWIIVHILLSVSSSMNFK